MDNTVNRMFNVCIMVCRSWIQQRGGSTDWHCSNALGPAGYVNTHQQPWCVDWPSSDRTEHSGSAEGSLHQCSTDTACCTDWPRWLHTMYAIVSHSFRTTELIVTFIILFVL